MSAVLHSRRVNVVWCSSRGAVIDTARIQLTVVNRCCTVPTLLESEGVALVEQHGVEQKSSVLPVGSGGVARVVLFQEVHHADRISVKLLKAPVS